MSKKKEYKIRAWIFDQKKKSYIFTEETKINNLDEKQQVMKNYEKIVKRKLFLRGVFKPDAWQHEWNEYGDDDICVMSNNKRYVSVIYEERGWDAIPAPLITKEKICENWKEYKKELKKERKK